MYDYLKMGSRIAVVLYLIFLTSLSFAQDTNVDERLEKESKIIENIFNEISVYFTLNKPCFDVDEICEVEHRHHINMIFDIISLKGWDKDEYRFIEMQVRHNEYGEYYIYVVMHLKSHVKDGGYLLEWILENNEFYVKNN
jgi:hypothetical protein